MTPSTISQSNPDRIVNSAELRKIVPYSDMHFWRLEKDGRFPRRIRLGANRVGWSLAEVIDWIEQKKAARSGTDALSAGCFSSWPPLTRDLGRDPSSGPAIRTKDRD